MNTLTIEETAKQMMNEAYAKGLEHALKICLDSQTLKEAIARIESLKAQQDV